MTNTRPVADCGKFGGDNAAGVLINTNIHFLSVSGLSSVPITHAVR